MRNGRSRFARILVSLVVAAAVSSIGYGYFQWGPCGKARVAEAAASLQGLAGRWDDASALAETTSRIALATQVAELQAIKRDVVSLAVPTCLAEAQRRLEESMAFRIEGYLAFMRDSDNRSQALVLFLQADTRRAQFSSQLSSAVGCSPMCP